MNPERWQEIERLYNQALALNPDARASFLDQACMHDEELRKEVDALLGSRSEIDRLMEDPAMAVAAEELAREQEQAETILNAGQTIAHYHVVREIGRGGMGIVYQAEDTRLKRTVALKVLPHAFAANPERLARFEREARILASLNHPNVAAIHGLEEAGDKHVLVLELVDGETLAGKIAKGPLPLDETLNVCRQIAEGLDAAHERGIVHRDLKPSNIKITPEGKVKLLDFGLAKAFREDHTAADAMHPPVITDQSTSPGVILGTAAYMSPEQASGKAVDKRADIWAFGCILYECLSGKRAFAGDSTTEVIAAILKSDPDWSAVPEGMPEGLYAALQHCLHKDPKFRIHDIADAWMEIERATSAAAKAELPRHPRSRKWLLAAGLLLIAGTSIGLVLIYYLQPGPRPLMVKSVIRLGPGRQLSSLNVLTRPTRHAVAISSDGSYIVYGASEGKEGTAQLFLRRSGELEAKPIAGTEGGRDPFLSPDNRQVGFYKVETQKLWRIPIEGGIPTPLCDADKHNMGASWGPDNSIVFSPGFESGLFRVSAEGGKPEPLTILDSKRQEASHRNPFCLPGGNAVLFTIVKHDLDLHPRVACFDYRTRQTKVLLEDAADARYVPGGYLVFLKQGLLMAIRFSEDSLETAGEPRQVLSDIVMQSLNYNTISLNSGAGQFAISPAGHMVYAVGGIAPEFQKELVWVDKKGNVTSAVAEKKNYMFARLSPDGGKIAYYLTGVNRGIWVYDMVRHMHIPLSEVYKGSMPIWWGNERVVFSGYPESNNLFWRRWDRSSEVMALTKSDNRQRPISWHPDGRTLAIVEARPDTLQDICLYDAASGRVVPFICSKAHEMFPEFRPDGRYLAYASDETGQPQIWIRSLGDPLIKRQVYNAGGSEPVWSPDGNQLFFRREDAPQGDSMWVSDIKTDRGLEISEPHFLFVLPGRIQNGAPTRSYDLSRDGQRFLVVQFTREQESPPVPATELILFQNWTQELKRLLPAHEK